MQTRSLTLFAARDCQGSNPRRPRSDFARGAEMELRAVEIREAPEAGL
jgi:hypothetical protein